MVRRRNRNFSRAISVVDYILEENGHTVAEAAQEFRISKDSIRKDLNYYGIIAFYGNTENSKELQKNYQKMRKTLARLATENHYGGFSSKKAVSN